MRFRRSDPALEGEDDPSPALREALTEVVARRALSTIPVSELPVTQGLAQLHADTVASLPLVAVNASGPLKRQPAIVTQPDPDEDVGTTLAKLVQSLWWTGNAYALISWPPSGYAPALALKVLDPGTVTYVEDPADPLRVAGWEVDGYRYPRSDVLHLKLNDDPRRGPLGASPLTRCGRALDWAGWAYEHLAAFYEQGGLPSMMLKSSRRLTATRASDALDAWIAARQERRPAVLGPDWTLDVPPTSGLEAFTEVLGWATAEVCRATNVPPSLANAPAAYALTYANVSDELRRWLATSLRPTWLARIEAGFSRLLPRGTEARFLDEALYRAEDAGGSATTGPAGEGEAGRVPAASDLSLPGPAPLSPEVPA